MKKKRKDTSGRVLKAGESQRKDKTYMYRWTSVNGKRETLYAKTLEELREKEAEIQREISVGVSRTNITLNQQIEIYMETKVNLRPATRENYKYYYHHCIENSRLGQMKIVDIRKSDVLMFYRGFYESGLSVGTIKILQKVIHPALQLACDDNIIMKNPSDGCMAGYKEEREKKFALTLDEEAEFLDRVKSSKSFGMYYPMYAIMLQTGLRLSEVVGLTWSDVDLDGKVLNVNQQVQYRKINGEMKFFASETKTNAGKRTIPMTEELYQLFLEQKKVWLQMEKDTEFEVDGVKNFVFISHRTGRCMRHTSIRSMIDRIVAMNSKREVELPKMSTHILRHTRCCRWAESKCDIKVLQYWMGQTDIRVTMQTYNHINEERARREMNRLENIHQYTPKFTPIRSEVV